MNEKLRLIVESLVTKTSVAIYLLALPYPELTLTNVKERALDLGNASSLNIYTVFLKSES